MKKRAGRGGKASKKPPITWQSNTILKYFSATPSTIVLSAVATPVSSCVTSPCPYNTNESSSVISATICDDTEDLDLLDFVPETPPPFEESCLEEDDQIKRLLNHEEAIPPIVITIDNCDDDENSQSFQSKASSSSNSGSKGALRQRSIVSFLNSSTDVVHKFRPEGKSIAKINVIKQKPSSGKPKRECPFYKWIPGTNFTIDAFSYGDINNCHAYFLTHFHYDHYGGLKKSFRGNIYCSKITGNLVEKRIGLPRKYIHILELNETTHVQNISVTAMEANHCPGAILLLFEVPGCRPHLHTGDFRATPEMLCYPALKTRLNGGIDTLFLDTTYCDPAYTFPSQEVVISATVDLVNRIISIEPDTLIVCGTYTLGKERIFSAIAESLNCKVWARKEKLSILECLQDSRLSSLLTSDWLKARLHLLPIGQLTGTKLEDHRRHLQVTMDKQRKGDDDSAYTSCYTKVLALRPTGWTFAADKGQNKSMLKVEGSGSTWTIYGVPYSEHSSYLELHNFVSTLRPTKIRPTVNNGSETARSRMESIFRSWMKSSVKSLDK